MSESIVLGQGAIRTPDQRLRVFVSSTLVELADERAAARTAVERLHLTPVMFELGARPHPPRDLYRSYLAQSHVFVGIYGRSYGWVAPGEELSGLEDEYRLAAGLPQLLYVKDEDERDPRLEELLGRIRQDDRASYRSFTSARELSSLVEDDLALLLTERFEHSMRSARSTSVRPPRWSALPMPLTPTIGRDAAIRAVADRLIDRRARLVTITGPGGVGKSRLGLEVARRVVDGFPDGVHLIPLEPVGEASDVLRAIADRVGVLSEGQRSLADLLAADLAERRMLLLLDNFEHVPDAAPDIATLLDRCAHLQVLATSRRPLRVHGEHEYPLLPLETPVDDTLTAASSPAVELFLARARSVRPDLTITPAELPAVAELVRRLDGLPLAIELAAARTRLLSPAALLARLEERLDLLSGGAVDAPERQRTLRATIDWSYRLLRADEQRLLDRFSVFAGPTTIEAVEAVCAEPDDPSVLEQLSSLLETNLLLSSQTDDGPRLRLLRTVRIHAAERLAARDDAEAIADRHADWFLGRVGCVDIVHNPSAPASFDDLLAEVDDIRRAMDRVLAQRDLTRTARFAGATWAWFWLRGRSADVRPWFEAAAALTEQPDAAPMDRGLLLHAVGQIRQLMGDAHAAEDALLSALEQFETAGSDLGIAVTRITLAVTQTDLGRLQEGYEHSLAALETGERYAHPHVIGFAAAILGTMRMVRGDLAGAQEAHRRSVEIARQAGFAILEAQALSQLAVVEAFEGRNVPGAWAYLAEAATVLRGTGSREILSYWLEFAAVTLEWQDPDEALRATIAGERIRDELELVIWPPMRAFHRAFVARMRELAADRADAIAASARAQDPWQLMDDLLARADPASAA